MSDVVNRLHSPHILAYCEHLSTHIAKINNFRKLPRYAPMKDAKQIRRDNLSRLLAEAAPSTYAELERRTGVKANYMTQVMNEGKHQRNLGDQAARRLENGMNKPTGWMDQNHEDLSYDDLSDGELTVEQRDARKA